MNRIGVVPLYTVPKDKRILAYLQKQVQIHDLHSGSTVSKVSCPPTGGGNAVKGNGFIRHALIGIAATPFLYGLLWWAFAFGTAMTMEIPQ